MISESNILEDLKRYHIIGQNAAPEELPDTAYKSCSIDHFKLACRLIDDLADKAQLADRLRMAKFGLADAQDTAVENSLVTFLAFAISAIALYLTISPEVPLGIDDWVLVTIFSGSFIILFAVLLIERIRNRKRRFYCEVFEYMLSRMKD